MFKPRDAMLDFGFQPHVAGAPAAAPVMVIGQARGTVIGILAGLYYARGRLDVVDTIMAVAGAYAGLVDSWVVWRGGKRRMAAFRLVSSGLIAGWGLAGWTAGGGW